MNDHYRSRPVFGAGFVLFGLGALLVGAGFIAGFVVRGMFG